MMTSYHQGCRATSTNPQDFKYYLLFFKLANTKTICKKVENYEIVVHWSNRVENMFFVSFVFFFFFFWKMMKTRVQKLGDDKLV